MSKEQNPFNALIDGLLDVVLTAVHKEFDHDEDGEIINGPKTYKILAHRLLQGDSSTACLIGWYDGKHTHHDLLFTRAMPIGNIQGGIGKVENFFIAVMRAGGAWGFTFNPEIVTEAPYIAEKMGLPLETAESLAELVNGIRGAHKAQMTDNDEDHGAKD